MSELQRIVDSVASRVGRSALIEDRRQRVVVYSEQTEPMDEVRQLSILRRQTTAEVIAFFRQAGVQQAREPIRTPACEALHMLSRVCIPIWHGDLLLGFVWFIDPDQSMTDDQIAAVSTTTTDLALALYRENLAGELASQRETEAIRLLLADEQDARQHGAMTLLEEGVLTANGPTTAIVARLVLTPGARLDDLARIALEQALLSSRRWLGPARGSTPGALRPRPVAGPRQATPWQPQPARRRRAPGRRPAYRGARTPLGGRGSGRARPATCRTVRGPRLL